MPADQNTFLPDNLSGWANHKGKSQESGPEAAESGKGLDLAGLASQSLDGNLGKLAELAGSFSNPLQAAATIGVTAIQAISKAVDDCNDRFAKLTASAKEVNDILHQLVALRPTATDEWMKFTEQMAKLGEQGDKLGVVQEQMNSTLEGYDENKIKNAFDFEKPALERQAITDQISNVQSDLAYDKKHAGAAGAAQQHANETANTVADLKHQIQALPTAIQQARGNAKEALDEAKAHAGNPWENSRDMDYSFSQQALAGRLQQMLDNAKAQFPQAVKAAADAEANLSATKQNTEAMGKLQDKLVELTNKLAVFDDYQKGKARHDQIQGTIDYHNGSDQSIDEMAKAIHLSQEDTVKIAKRIVDHQITYQAAITDLHHRMDQIEGQQKSARNSQGGQG